VGRLIDADALVDEIKSCHCADCDRRKGTKNGKVVFCYQIGDAPCRACGIGDAIEYLEDAPTVDAVPVVHGKKLSQSPVDPKSMICFKKCVCKCSVCGEYVAKDWNYCSNCGAKMDGRVDIP